MTSGFYRLDRLNEFPVCPDPVLFVRNYGFAVVNNTEVYVAFAYVEEPDDLDLPEEALNRQRIWLEHNNFCKFDLKSNKWTILTPMKNLVDDYRLRLHKFDDYLYALGHGIHDVLDDYLIQRYNLVTDTWEDHITVNMPGENLSLQYHAVVDGHILFTGFKFDDDGDMQDVFLAYNPTSNTIFKVDNKTTDTSIDITFMDFEVDESGRCFLFGPLHGRNQERMYRVYTDITSDHPSLTLELQGDRTKTNHWNRKDSERPSLTFDKRKLKMAKEAVKCDCH